MTRKSIERPWIGTCSWADCHSVARWQLVSTKTDYKEPFCTRHRNLADVVPDSCRWVDFWETGA